MPSHRSISFTLFPYTTLFRSLRPRAARRARAGLATRTRRHRARGARSEEHTSELQSHHDLVCRLLLEKKIFRLEAIAMLPDDLQGDDREKAIGEIDATMADRF